MQPEDISTVDETGPAIEMPQVRLPGDLPLQPVQVRSRVGRHCSRLTRSSRYPSRTATRFNCSSLSSTVPDRNSRLSHVSAKDVDALLQRFARDPGFPHGELAQHAIRFRTSGDVADLVAILDDPHPGTITEEFFALAGAERPWLNWVPMPTEAICHLANEFCARRAQGDHDPLTHVALTAAEPPSAVTAGQRVSGPFELEITDFPVPDLRNPLQNGQFGVWRYDGTQPVPAVPAPATTAVHLLHHVAAEPWVSPLSGYLRAAPLGELPLDDLLGLLAHLPEPPETPRWRHLALTTPTYWYRFLQPWVCLAILHHASHEPWANSTRRQVLVDLVFGVEDWVADSAAFALVTNAYTNPEARAEVRRLIRSRLDAAASADRLVTIENSLARLMLVTPGCDTEDADAARAALARSADDTPPEKRRWWQRRR